MRVRVTDKGYIFSRLWAPGEEITLTDEAQFAASWMERIGGSTAHPLDHDGDGNKGGSVPSAKPKAAERIAMARELTGRDDITTAKEADAILAMTDPAPFSDDAPIEAVDD